MKRLLLAVLGLATLCGCGGSNPAAPTQVAATPPPPANIAGTWTGTFHAHALDSSGSAFPFTEPFTMTLTQSGGSVSGTWVADGNPDRTGTVGGAVTPTIFNGTFTYHRKVTNGRCVGTITLSGATSNNSVHWTSPGVLENCSNAPTGITIDAAK
jgi:hypothetical protein